MIHSKYPTTIKESSNSHKAQKLIIVLLITFSCHYVNKIPLAASKPMNFASPLKSLTIPDRMSPPSPRSNFLFKFKAGIEGERRARKEIAEETKRLRQFEEGDVEVDDENVDFFESSKWAEMSADKFDNFKEEKRNRIASSFDDGFSSCASQLEAAAAGATNGPSPKSANEYQFVGVVQSDKNVKWFGRSKPKNSKWSVRVINVDKAALLRDLFVRGKIDVYGSYTNNGIPAIPAGKEGAYTEETVSKLPIIDADYSVKERSWN